MRLKKEHQHYRSTLRNTLIILIISIFQITLPAQQATTGENQDKLKNVNFEESILMGEEFFKAKDYPQAKKYFEKALELDPLAKYPKDRLTAIRSVYSDPADVSRFNEAMAKGNRNLDARHYDEARSWFEIALSAQPDSRQAREKIAETDRKKAEDIDRKQRYDKIILEAERLYSQEKREESRKQYQEALALIPGDPAVLKRIEEIDDWFNQKKAKQDAFEKAVEQGDQFYMNRDFPNASLKYKEALAIKPEARYPKDMLEKARQSEQKYATDKERYDAVIASADASLKSGNLETALTGYRDALAIIPGMEYPRVKAEEIEKQIQVSNSRKEAYDIAIKNGDQALAEMRYEFAISAYKEALALLPGEKYPSDKIASINEILSRQKADRDKYISLIADADRAYSTQDYDQALSRYSSASALMPGEQYPADRIAAISQILKDNAARQEMYDQAMTTGEKLYSEQQYIRALAAFEEAAALKPDEAGPKERITSINTKLASEKALNENYSAFIAEGNQYFTSGNYEKALEVFSRAGKLKPDATYPQDKIKEINILVEDMKSKQGAYDKAIADADLRLSDKDYLPAIASYELAQKIKPGERYPADRITEIRDLLAEIKAKQEEYDQSIAEGDRYAGQQELEKAILFYDKAVKAKPAETYPPAKIKELQKILAERKSKNDAYAQAISDGDLFFSQKKYREALEPYERASTIKPEEEYPVSQKVRIAALLEEQKRLDDSYNKLLADGETFLTSKDYRASLKSFEDALLLKPDESYPREKVSEIKNILEEQQARDDSYNKALSEGDAMYTAQNLQAALESYTSASRIKPGETYPKERIQSIQLRLKEIDDRYSLLIREGDAKLADKQYSEAITMYQQAMEVKPGENYPRERITRINELLEREKEEQDRLYASSIAEGDQYLASQNYVDAQRAFVKASGIKPAEKYPRDKLLEINLVLDARAKAIQDEYNKAITDADKLYQQKILDQAIDAYQAAGAIKPDEVYPVDMVLKIKQYIADHSILQVNTNSIIIPAGDEKKFSFKGIEPRLKTNNYVMIRARALGENPPKVYFNYGRDSMKNGGIVLRTIGTQEGMDYLIRLAGQDKWYREDNNWLSLYTEGCDIEVSRIEISQGE